MGIEGRKLLTPEDEYEACESSTRGMRANDHFWKTYNLSCKNCLKIFPDLKERLDSFPSSIFSGRAVPKKGTKGVFFCYRLPAWDVDLEDFSTENGPCQWYLYQMENGNIFEEFLK